VLPVNAKQAIGVFDSGSGGMVTAAFLWRMLNDAGLKASTVFFGDTKNLPYGKRSQTEVAALSDAIIGRLSGACPVIGIACNTASAAWTRFGTVGKSGSPPRVLSVVKVAADLAYQRSRAVFDPQVKLRVKVIGVLGTELTATIQSHGAAIVNLHRMALSRAIGHELPLVPYEFDSAGIRPSLPAGVIDYARTPHIGVVREDEEAPGGTTRASIMNWEPPAELPHVVRIIARDAQKLVAAVDVAHVLDADGRVKVESAGEIREYLRAASHELVQRQATALILGCTHFEYFEDEFSRLLPTLSARNGIICPSGALACQLLDAYREFLDANPIQPVVRHDGAYFAFSGERPPDETFKALAFNNVTLVKELGAAQAGF
jgi:glutamate racemase